MLDNEHGFSQAASPKRQYPWWSQIGLVCFVVSGTLLALYFWISTYSPVEAKAAKGWIFALFALFLASALTLGPFIKGLFSLPFDLLVSLVRRLRRRTKGVCASCHASARRDRLVSFRFGEESRGELLCAPCLRKRLEDAVAPSPSMFLAVQPLRRFFAYRFYSRSEMRSLGMDEQYVESVLRIMQESSTFCACGKVPKAWWCSPSVISFKGVARNLELGGEGDTALCPSCFAAAFSQAVEKHGSIDQVILPSTAPFLGISKRE